VTHEIAFKKFVSEGNVSGVHCAPPSALVQMYPEGPPSGTTESPTMKHCETPGHEIPRAPGIPCDGDAAGTLAVSQVLPPFDVVMMVVANPDGPPPTAMQCCCVLHVTRPRLFSPVGSATTFQ
jgi:hypothetical protein